MALFEEISAGGGPRQYRVRSPVTLESIGEFTCASPEEVQSAVQRGTDPDLVELGQRIYENVSKEGWEEWLQRLQMIMNENQLNTADPTSIELIESHMLGFFFDEGDHGGLPQGFRAAGGKK